MPTITPKKSHDPIIANRLKIFREQYIDKSQNQASKKLGIAQSALSYMENGMTPIYFKFISQLVKEFHLNQDWLTTGNGKPTEKNPSKPTLLTDLNALNEELSLLKKQIQMMEANQNYMLKIINELRGEIRKTTEKS